MGLCWQIGSKSFLGVHGRPESGSRLLCDFCRGRSFRTTPTADDSLIAHSDSSCLQWAKLTQTALFCDSVFGLYSVQDFEMLELLAGIR